jgi:uncharacterized membrane protein
MLVLLTALFGIVHVSPQVSNVKAQLGKAFGPVYGIASLALLIGMVWAYRQSPSTGLYQLGDWAWWANWVLALAGFVCLGIFLFRGSWRNALRYPMALAVCLWALGHLLANGDGRSLIFFGGLMFAALVQAWLLQTRGFVPAPVRQGHNMLSVLFGVALYGIMTQLHYVLTGMELIRLR